MAKRTSPPESSEVGPGRPPEHSRFKKGQSGNPGGRPRLERDLGKLVNAELDEVVPITENGKPVRLTKRQLVAKSLVNEAAKGNLKALDALIKIVGSSTERGDELVGVDPAMLASFLARYAPGSGGGSE